MKVKAKPVRIIKSDMELEEEPVPPPTDRYPELEAALRELQIHISSAKMREAAERIAIVADSAIPVLILGESGTGKELYARLLHRLSDRRNRPFSALNCGAIPADLIESELFGHVKGAFTSAVGPHRGAFEQADKGTLFLDEIGDLPPMAQTKFLRVLQEGEIKRLGDEQVRKVDVRIVAATNHDLRRAVADKRFRLDLYHRLRIVEVSLPPLRERREDIGRLAVWLLERINKTEECQKKLAKASMLRLNQYSWPGNVRELDNVLKASVLFTRKKDVIEPEDLPIDTIAPVQGYLDRLPAPAPGFDLNEFLAAVRVHQIRKALSICNDNQSRAAELLGMSRQAVSEFLSKEDVKPA